VVITSRLGVAGASSSFIFVTSLICYIISFGRGGRQQQFYFCHITNLLYNWITRLLNPLTKKKADRDQQTNRSLARSQVASLKKVARRAQVSLSLSPITFSARQLLLLTAREQ
jgi:hypothetical protein